MAALDNTQGTYTVYLKKAEACNMPVMARAPIAHQAHPVQVSHPAPDAAPKAEAKANEAPVKAEVTVEKKEAPAKATGTEVKSPLIGTFYRSPSPDAPSYVEVGTVVKKGQPLCILEAMKMMNTLEAEFDGVVEEILVQNGDLVEFDQPIFIIKKS